MTTMCRNPIILLLIAALVKEITGCPDAEKTEDGTKSKVCFSDKQCGIGYSCEPKSSLCCPLPVMPCMKDMQELTKDGQYKKCNRTEECGLNYQCRRGICCSVLQISPTITESCSKDNLETTADGQIKACSESNQICSTGYLCQQGTCCSTSPLEVKMNIGECPSKKNMAVGLCFDINNDIRCTNDQDCEGGQLCCDSGCGKVCTEPAALTPCQEQFKMAAVQLLTKKDICTPVYIPRCDGTGQFEKKQCLDMLGICWCVHENGTKIEGSEVRGNPDCLKATKPGSCPDPSYWMTIDLLDDGCLSDSDCSGQYKCCSNGLGSQCVPPDGMLTTTERDKRSLPTGCPNGKTMKCCDADLCLHAICSKNPHAVCRINPCDDCSLEFYDRLGRKVDSCDEGMSQCEKTREDLLPTIALWWLDTTNPPWLEGRNAPLITSISPLWLDTTNPIDVTRHQSDNLYSAAPQGSNNVVATPKWLDTTLLLQKISEDGADLVILQSPPTAMSSLKIGDYVCPVILPMTTGICQPQCNNDTDCGGRRKCCFNGCAKTCADPVQVTSTEVCKLPPVSGECIDLPYVNRIYFNQKSGQCETFSYREGCEGSANNFLTTDACDRGCKKDIPGHCLVDPEPGVCKGYFPMWFYNVTSGKCDQFIYGGCAGNKNRFSTEQQCYLSCSSKSKFRSACGSLFCSDSSVCLAYNETYAECTSKMNILPSISSYVPDCTDGLFSAEQCSGTICWCVDPNTGAYIRDTLRIGPAPCSTSDNAALTESRKPVCQNGITPSPCVGACQKASCHRNPDALCVPDPCNNCSVIFYDKNRNPVNCEMNKCKSKKPDISEQGSSVSCGIQQMRYVYNPEKLQCEGFLYNRCHGNDVYFTSYFDCQEQCAGSMCSESHPMTCDNTCFYATCSGFTGALCQVNLCNCQPEFYDPVTKQKVDCDAVAPVCQLKRSIAYHQVINVEKKGISKKPQFLPVCDENGDFKPQQCGIQGLTCWCVDGIGRMIPDSTKTVSVIGEDIQCKKNSTRTAVISFIFPHDYDTHAKGKEEKLRQLIVDAIKRLSSEFEKLIKIIMIKKRSIKVEVELEDSSAEGNQHIASHANLLESEIRNGFTINMDGTVMTADADTVNTSLTFQAQGGANAAHLDDDTISRTELWIIIGVVCGVLVIVFVILIICANRKSNRRKQADIVTVENNQRPNSIYFKNEACDTKEEKFENGHEMSVFEKEDEKS